MSYSTMEEMEDNFTTHDGEDEYVPTEVSDLTSLPQELKDVIRNASRSTGYDIDKDVEYFAESRQKRSSKRVISESDDENEYSSQIDETKKLLDSTSNARGVYVRAGGFCPYLAFIRLDALDQEDWPHGINDNSYYTEFEVDFRSGTIEINRCGIIPFNKDDPDMGYYYGFGEKQLMLKTGRKPFRKCRFKSIEALVDKMNTFYDSYVSALEEYKGCGYPYGAEKD